MPDSVGRLHFALIPLLVCRTRAVFFCLLFSIFKVGEHCHNSSNYPTLHKSAKSVGDLSAQIREICGRPIIRIYAKIFSANCIFLIFFGYIIYGEFLLRIVLNRRVQCQKKSESQTTLCSQPSCRTRGYADHSSSACLESALKKSSTLSGKKT